MPQVVFAVGDDISTDVIYPGRYMATVLPTETPQYAFADDLDFNGRVRKKQVPPGGIILAGKNFGCGSSREQAVSCLKGHDFIIVARSFARIFFQNAVNLGLKTVTCPDIEASEGDELDIGHHGVVNKTTGKRFEVIPLPRSRQVLLDAGGLIPYTRQRLLEKAGRTS